VTGPFSFGPQNLSYQYWRLSFCDCERVAVRCMILREYHRHSRDA